jgi:hypothetical protein
MPLKKSIQLLCSVFLFLLQLWNGQAQGQNSSESSDDYVVAYSIRGQVLDRSELPLPGATVTLFDSETGQKKSVFTDKNGIYHFDCLTGGRYSLTFALRGFITERMENFTYRVPQSLVIDRMLQLDTAGREEWVFPAEESTKALTVFVKNKVSSTNLDEVEIVVVDANNMFYEFRQTDACGTARAFLKPLKKYTINISKDGFAEKAVSFEMPDRPKDLEIQLEPNK